MRQPGHLLSCHILQPHQQQYQMRMWSVESFTFMYYVKTMQWKQYHIEYLRLSPQVCTVAILGSVTLLYKDSFIPVTCTYCIASTSTTHFQQLSSGLSQQVNGNVLNIFYHYQLIFCCTSQWTGTCASVQVRHWLLIHSLSLSVQSENLQPNRNTASGELYHNTDRVCYCRVKISNCYSQHVTNLTKGRNNLTASKLLNNRELG